jgi:hypothetical protein
MKFPDASGVSVNMLPISDGSAFDQLKLLLEREGDNLAGPDWLGMLAAIGIDKGQPFTPDAHTREIFDWAAKTAYKTAFAEFERSMVRERTRLGLQAARERGRFGGRLPKLSAHQRAEAIKMVESGTKTGAEVARLFRVHRSSISRLISQAHIAE